MLPDLRFVLAAVFCSIVLLFGTVGLMASRIGVNPVSQHALRDQSSPLVLAEGPRLVEGHSPRREGLHGLLSIQLGPAGARASAIVPAPETPRRAAPVEVAALSATPAAVVRPDSERSVPLPPVVVRATPAAGALVSPLPAPAQTAVRPAGAEFVAETVAPPTVLLASLSLSTTPWVQGDFELHAIVLPRQVALPQVALPAVAVIGPKAVATIVPVPESFAAAAALSSPQAEPMTPGPAQTIVAQDPEGLASLAIGVATAAPSITVAALSAEVPASVADDAAQADAAPVMGDVPWPPQRGVKAPARSRKLASRQDRPARVQTSARHRNVAPRSRATARSGAISRSSAHASSRVAQARAKAKRPPSDQQLRYQQQIAAQKYWAQQQRYWNSQWQQQRPQRRAASSSQTQ